MNWLTTLWAMITGASLAIAAVYMVAWLRSRESPAYLMFALLAASISLVAVAELLMFRAETADEFASALRWFHVPLFAALASCVGLVHYRLHSDRLWIGQLAIGVRAVSLIPNFTTGVNQNYLEITELRQIEVLGEQVSLAIGVPNPWMLLAQLSLVLLLAYIIDATIATWRRREDKLRQSLSVVLFMLVASGFVTAVLSFWGIAPVSVVVSPFFIGVAIVMGTELSVDLLRSRQLERDLRAGRERLDALSKAAALNVMSASIAHEINQPLGVIHSNAEAAQMLLDRDSPDLVELRATIEDIIKADRRASDVIRRLRALVHQKEPRLLPVNLNDVVENALSYLNDDLRASKVSINRYLDPGLPRVYSDHTLMVQVLMNLLKNAWDAVAANPAHQRRIDVITQLDDEAVQILVSDDGPGLPADASRVFDPFYTSKSSGLGLGLPIARSIVTSLGGTIRATSTDDNRTKFVVTFPMQSER